jgi:hypothetical protein
VYVVGFDALVCECREPTWKIEADNKAEWKSDCVTAIDGTRKRTNK